MMHRFGIAETDTDLATILRLQGDNLARSVSREEALEQGFVTVEHDMVLLKKISGTYSHIVARKGEAVVGYALVMLRSMEAEIPVLVPMFQKVNSLIYQGRSLRDAAYFIMGQICIEKESRGQGVFGGLYAEMKRQLAEDFEYVITEVSQRNQRSLRAHARVGFKTILEYTADDGEDWAVILLPLRA